MLQYDVAEELEVDEEDKEYGNFDGLENGEGGMDGEGEGYQVARRSLASIFGEAEVVEVDEAQADESLLVKTAPPWRMHAVNCLATAEPAACDVS